MTAPGSARPLGPELLERVRAAADAHHVRRLALFGSAARGEARPGDYDFLVAFESLPPLEHGRAYLRLLSELQALLSASVDLLEDQAIDNPYFRAAITPDLTELYAR